MNRDLLHDAQKMFYDIDRHVMKPVRWHIDARTLFHDIRGRVYSAPHLFDGAGDFMGLPVNPVASPLTATCIADIADITDIVDACETVPGGPFCMTLECVLDKNGRTVYVDHVMNEEPWK